MNQPSPSAAPAAAPTPTGPFKLPPLGYPYEALEPHIDAQTMNIHHTKHHQAYVNAANGFAEKWPQLGKQTLEETLANLSKVPEDIRTGVRNQVGGHWNHTFFWDLMTPGGGKEPTGDVKSAIEQFGGLSGLIEKINAAGAGRFGSGWAWLVVNKSKKLEILSTANQDSPIIEGNKAVLGVDVWEHAYYLKYQNRRPDYLKAWWNTVNWDKVSANLKKASA
ncbi:MAG: superoxide dismutase [Xanthobacteraceae bacterium]